MPLGVIEVDQEIESPSGSVAVKANDVELSSLISIEWFPKILKIGASFTGTTLTVME